jgi:hypothetical protein
MTAGSRDGRSVDPEGGHDAGLRIRDRRRAFPGRRLRQRGVFVAESRGAILRELERFLAATNAASIFNSALTQGITGWNGPAPTSRWSATALGDRGILFFEWVRDHVGRREYPSHVPTHPGS